MTVPEILNALEPYTRPFPMKAMRAAIEQREAITPGLRHPWKQCSMAQSSAALVGYGFRLPK